MNSETNEPKKVFGRPFQPGQSGNPNGRPKKRPFKDAIDAALKDGGESISLATIAKALLTKAASGDVAAIKELGDRYEGKVPQAIIGGDDDDPEIRTYSRIELIGVRAPDSDT